MSKKLTLLLNIKTNNKLDECSICLQLIYIDRKKISCGHIFHLKCIKKWNKSNIACPLCRVNINL